MWKPISLQFINFQSHIDTLYEYSSSLECIQGINLDIEDEQDKDKESNGSGKSVLIEGEYFSLLDSPLREDIRIEDLIYDKDPDIKGAETIFILENNFLDLKLKIHRKIWFKKSSELFLYTCKLKEEFTEKPNEEFSSVGEGDKRIIELLGVQREDLINYYIISKKKYKSFYRSSDDKKKEIVARFSGGYLIEGLDKEIENDIEKENDKLKIQDDKILFLNSKIEVHEEEIEKIKNKNIEEEKNERIEGIKETILSVENKIHSLLITRKDLNQSIKEAEDLLKIEESKSLDTKDKSKFSIKIEKLNNDKKVIKEKKIEYTNQMKGLKEELKEWEDFLIDVEKNVRGSVICPKCAHEFNISDGTLNIEDLKKKIPEIKQNIEDVKKEIEELQNKEKTEIEDILDKIDKDIEVCEKEITLIKTAEDKLSEAIRKFKNKIKEIKENLESNEKSEITYHKQISILEKDIEEIKKEEIIDKSKEHIIAIEKIKKELIEIEKEKIKINEIIENKVQWIYLFTSFRSHLANKAIKNIEGQANLFLQEMKSDLQIQLEGFTLLADKKTIREKISCEIIRNGMSAGLLGKCSEGEKARVELATILAMQKLLNLSNPSGGIDLLSIDEILESISKVGMEKIIQSLLNINGCIQLITHVNLDKDFSNISRFVIKENGISTLQLNNYI